MLYQEALNYILNISRFGSDYGLDRMQKACDFLSNPEDSLRFIHVAGTNGKGSVTAYLTSIFKYNGYKVGTYNSPYIYNYRERFLINGEMASEELVAKYLSIVKETIESIQKEENDFYLTAFEIETLAAFLMFKDEKVDIVVLEVGLGGRLDATNVIKNKELAIITSIGLDHCALLGNTLKEIAHEKAAIIKDVAITCMQDMDIIDAIGSHARKLIITAQPTLIQLDIESGQLIEYKSVQFKTKMLGAYQKENLSLALEAILYLISHGWDFNLDKIKEGVLNASWKVRFEVKKIKNKYVILDGSHNPQGASSLVDTLNVYFRNKNIHFIIGMLKDKDMKGILEILLPLSTRTTFISSVSSRAASTLEEENIARELGYDVYVSNDINKAIKEELTLDEDALVICGSLTLFETIEI